MVTAFDASRRTAVESLGNFQSEEFLAAAFHARKQKRTRDSSFLENSP
jgi:hypothetical protein